MKQRLSLVNRNNESMRPRKMIDADNLRFSCFLHSDLLLKILELRKSY